MQVPGDTNRFRAIDPARLLDDLRHPGLVSAIDLARWLAAAVVVIGHARFPLLKGYNQLTSEQRPLWVKAWYFVTGYHEEAVLLFFVLSGFLVGGMVCARLARRSFDPPSYAVDRFSRLYVAFFPALLLSVLLTWIGYTWFNGTGLYDASNPTFAEKATPISFVGNSGWAAFAGNLAMVQYYFAPPYGSNPPLWTLSSEFWFYATFGLAATAGLRRGLARIALAALAILAAAVLGPLFWYYFGMWLIGVAAAVVRPSRYVRALPAFLLLAGLLLLRRFGDEMFTPSEELRKVLKYAICLAMGLLLLGWRRRPPTWAARAGRFNKAMADFSYSLYLTHFPVIILTAAVAGAVSGNPGYTTGLAPTQPLALATYAAEVVLAFAFAWAFAQVTERRTAPVRNWLKRMLFPRARPVQAEPDRGHGGFE